MRFHSNIIEKDGLFYPVLSYQGEEIWITKHGYKSREDAKNPIAMINSCGIELPPSDNEIKNEFEL